MVGWFGGDRGTGRFFVVPFYVAVGGAAVGCGECAFGDGRGVGEAETVTDVEVKDWPRGWTGWLVGGQSAASPGYRLEWTLYGQI